VINKPEWLKASNVTDIYSVARAGKRASKAPKPHYRENVLTFVPPAEFVSHIPQHSEKWRGATAMKAADKDEVVLLWTFEFVKRCF
jgi:hypothetical protein